MKNQQVPGEDTPAWPPTSEQRPPTHIPEDGKQVDSKKQDKPQAHCLSPASFWERYCLFLACSLICAAKAVTQRLLAPDNTLETGTCPHFNQ